MRVGPARMEADALNTRYLQEFIELARDPNWSKAARSLFLARPTLVEHVRCLESELGCQLVESQGSSVRLTAQGKVFVRTAKEMLERWNSICTTYNNLSNNMLIVTISSSNLPWIESLLFSARQRIEETHPGKHIEVVPCQGAFSTTRALEDSDIVVAGIKTYREARTFPDQEGITSFPLCTEEIFLLMSRQHPSFGKGSLSVRDVAQSTFVLPADIYESWRRDDVESYFMRHGAQVFLQRLEVSSHAEYFAHNFGDSLGIVPKTLVSRFGLDCRDDIRVFSLDDLKLETSFFAVCKQEFVASELGMLLMQTMSEMARA